VFNRRATFWYTFVFGIFLIFFTSIPLVFEGASLMALSRLDKGSFESYCQMNQKEVKALPKWPQHIMTMAK
jgi:hypothetical protein